MAENVPVPDSRLPAPDPTLLTRQVLQREIATLRELMEARLDAIDKATTLFEANLTRVPTDTDKQIAHLRELLQSTNAEKFRAIQLQFEERDVRTEQTSRDSKVAVDAALQAAKEAVGEQNKSSALAIAKSEAATTKQIDQQGLLITTATAGLNDKIDDIKDRLTRIEGQDKGQQMSWAVLLGGIGGLSGLVAIIYTLFLRK